MHRLVEQCHERLNARNYIHQIGTLRSGHVIVVGIDNFLKIRHILFGRFYGFF